MRSFHFANNGFERLSQPWAGKKLVFRYKQYTSSSLTAMEATRKRAAEVVSDLESRSTKRHESSATLVKEQIITRQRLSTFFIPSIKARQPAKDRFKVDSNELLKRCGFFATPYSGIYHYLPLGVRVLEKLEKLVDKHMKTLGASKVSLSSFSSPDLWQESQRLEANKAELFQLKDRRNKPLLLSPTHEEEITCLVGSLVSTYQQLPLRLYQVSRKYRDEKRPRAGLLRAREFLMKDLYTFDQTTDSARATYLKVGGAYSNFFRDLKLDFLVANASSGLIGGDSSHEYHLVSAKGEDEVASCTCCDYVANIEVAERSAENHLGTHEIVTRGYISSGTLEAIPWLLHDLSGGRFEGFHYLTEDHNTLVVVLVSSRNIQRKGTRVNEHLLKTAFNVDTGIKEPYEQFSLHAEEVSKEDSLAQKLKIVYFFTGKLRSPGTKRPPPVSMKGMDIPVEHIWSDKDFIRLEEEDRCPKCSSGSIVIQKCIEVGHTFDLGTRYSSLLGGMISMPAAGMTHTPPSETDLGAKSTLPSENQESLVVPMQMGCHGIGISRLVAAVAEIRKDAQGLNWPRSIAPFEVVIIPAGQKYAEHVDAVYDTLSSGPDGIDCVIDDRIPSYGANVTDAELIGYPVIIGIGGAYLKDLKTCFVTCRQLGVDKRDVALGELKAMVIGLLDKL